MMKQQQRMTLVALLLVMFMMMWQQPRHQQRSKNKYRCAPNGTICGGWNKPCDHCCNNHSLGNKADAWGWGWYCKDDIKGKDKLSAAEKDSDMYK